MFGVLYEIKSLEHKCLSVHKCLLDFCAFWPVPPEFKNLGGTKDPRSTSNIRSLHAFLFCFPALSYTFDAGVLMYDSE